MREITVADTLGDRSVVMVVLVQFPRLDDLRQQQRFEFGRHLVRDQGSLSRARVAHRNGKVERHSLLLPRPTDGSCG